jgi:hypothetical protein
MPRDAFEGYDEPIKIDMDPEEALKLVLQQAPTDEAEEPDK